MSIKKLPIRKETLNTIAGLFFLALTIVMVLSFISFFLNGKSDQSQLGAIFDPNIVAKNSMGKLGAFLSYIFIYYSLGIAAFFIPFFLFIFSIKILFKKELIKIWKTLSHSLFFLVWLPLALGYLFQDKWFLAGLLGIETGEYLQTLIGKIGLGFALLFSLIIYFVLEFNVSPDKIRAKFNDLKVQSNSLLNNDIKEEETDTIAEETKPTLNDNKKNVANLELDEDKKEETFETQNTEILPVNLDVNPLKTSEIETENTTEEISFEVEKVEEEIDEIDDIEVLANKIVAQSGKYDPRLDLADFKFPKVEMLTSYAGNENISVDQAELELNKNKIVETLGHYNIGIDKIKATIGPTVTLYEIIPEAGVRISKIKNLEDDIALSLAALGIRIIAPIPGKGTIGIEVPNAHPTMVSMRSVIQSQKFNMAEMELPIAFGKTISNETFVTDLAKMPHLLMAGATGQGKSVGLNAVITSLLYKKHPNELKFVFVDPKKVELTLYNKIERHYLAKLPDTEEAIITDNDKVVQTLVSLTIEMDERYGLLKDAMVRNIKEYNEKFISRKLNPDKGHKFLPYIVLVVDEFADLIMTAGKEVEMPIARLAQLARAIGIHLIIATQRPSVNVITGIIKANFPARVAFRVTSKIDSRTILDNSGADQLIGKGDMLFTTGNDLVRLQCAFIDTPEVEKITDFIGSQKGPATAYLLPEYQGDEHGENSLDTDEKDDLFDEAARVLVYAQQGSTSLLQRKLSIGYNRAGRIIDQLEAAGVVGPFEGSKARKVLYTDIDSLEQFLNSLN